MERRRALLFPRAWIVCVVFILLLCDDAYAAGAARYDYKLHAENATCDDFAPLVDAPERFSESVLNKLNADYYASNGVSAFSEGVPYFITSNSKVARAYARAIIAYAADLCASGALDFEAPLYVVELGAGHGRLSHSLIHEIREARLSQPALRWKRRPNCHCSCGIHKF